MEILFFLAVLIFSVILHEVAHGYMAERLGDPTARLQGRLTLNPISHIDPVGSVLLPGLLLFSQQFTHFPFLIGYAKPVPYNPYNLRGRYAEGLVAFAGPATNIFLAVVFGLLIRFSAAQLGPDLVAAFGTIVYINMLLALFNLLPVPPLDGSKVLSSLLGLISPALERGYDSFRINFERLGVLSGTLLLLILFYYFSPFFSAVLFSLFSLLTGASI